jgi:putative endopeptidase
MVKKLIPCILLAAAFGCNEADKNAAATTDPLFENIDTTVKPGDDFFDYANGKWIKENPIPNSEASWGIGNLVQEDIYLRLRAINENAVKEKSAEGSISRKIGDFWAVAMDSTTIEKQGLQPLLADLALIDSANSIASLVKLSAVLAMKGASDFFGSYIGQDDKNSSEMALILYQGGLGLPNRDYYFDNDAKTTEVRKAYISYLIKTLQQLGNDATTAAKNANDIFLLETRLAKASRKLADLRDPYKNYNKMTVSNLQRLSPSINWAERLAISNIKNLDSVIVGQPEFFKALSGELTSTPLDVWKNYMRFNYVSTNAEYLDSTTFNNMFEYDKTISGAKQPRPRWKRVLNEQEELMGEALGQLFVKEYFNETAKKRYEGLVESVRDAYKERIAKLPWMSDSTKQKAYAKLAKISPKVGFPNTWKDFSSMQIAKDSYVANVQRAHQWWHNYQVSKLGKPVDREEWQMSPQTYNAYYNPSNNEIVLPAGIFAIPGKKDAELDDALVYGYAAASTIGHEITHGFDDQGRQYDADGNLKNWWTPSDDVAFSTRAKVIINQFNAFVPVDTLHVNGDATQGENIADLGGLLLGLDAFKKTETYKKGEKINGLTPLQRYFLGYAYAWMYNTRTERLAARIKTDVHSPARERVNGPMANIPEFYEAFDVKPGDKMYIPDSLRVKIW